MLLRMQLRGRYHVGVSFTSSPRTQLRNPFSVAPGLHMHASVISQTNAKLFSKQRRSRVTSIAFAGRKPPTGDLSWKEDLSRTLTPGTSMNKDI